MRQLFVVAQLLLFFRVCYAEVLQSLILAELSTFVKIDDSKPILIVPLHGLGLANRLRIASSLFSYALSINAHILYVWGSSEDCFVNFDELFTSTFPVISVDSSVANGNFDRFSKHLTDSTTNACTALDISLRQFSLSEFLIDEDRPLSRVNIVRTFGTHAPRSYSCGDYLYAKKLFYQQLTPSLQVQHIVDSVNLKGGMVMGVHIRAFDATHDWNVVNPSIDSLNLSFAVHNNNTDTDTVYNLTSRSFPEASPLDAFATFMHKLIAHFPKVRFLLASNSGQAKTLMTAAFEPGRVITVDSEHTGVRHRAEGMVVAAAEFWLLGATALVVHSTASSFAREAAARSMLSVIDVSFMNSFVSCEFSVEICCLYVSCDSLIQSMYVANTPQVGTSQVPVVTTSADGLITTEMQRKDVYFYSQRDSLPHCGMPEYVRAAYVRRQHTRKAERELREGIDGSRGVSGEIDDIGKSSDEVANGVFSHKKVNTENDIDQVGDNVHKICYSEDNRIMCSVTYSICECSRDQLLYGVSVEGLYCNSLREKHACISILAESNGHSV